jgi:flavoprotein family protein
MKVGIVGAGASGLAAAIAAAKAGAKVIVWEHNKSVGKKILATGNGKCNYTNLLMNPDCFHLKEGAAPLQVIEDFGSEDAIAFFQELGVEPFSRDGYIYPKSEQAVAIAQALEVGVRRWGGEIVTEVSIAKIKREKNGWNVIAQDRQWNVDRIIIATGLKASPTTGSDGSFLTLIEQMGYQVKSPLPALCALYAQEKNFFKKVAGVRIKCGLDVSVDQNIVASEYGELQLTDYGLSGIPIFQVSGRVARAIFEKKKVEIIVHFVEDKSFLLERKERFAEESMGFFGNGILNNKLWKAFLSQFAIAEEEKVMKVSKTKLSKLFDFLLSANFVIEKSATFDKAQVCSGGICCKEINFSDMSSKRDRALFFVGEIIDVDGICGGYNLHWAWASGIRAGRSAAKG